MPFVVRNNAVITRNMIAQLTSLNPAITDYTEGAVVRSILQSLANEEERSDLDLFESLKEAILVGTYKNFNFPKLPASYASGLLRVTVSGSIGSPQDIPLGNRFTIPSTSVIYKSTVDVTMNPSPGFVDIPVICQTVGSVGNVPAATITQAVDALTFAATISNLSPFINGADQESDDSRFQRFQNYIAGLSRGTDFALVAAAETVFLTDGSGNITERAVAAFAIEPFKTGGLIGNVWIFIDNGSGFASSALVAQVTQVLEGYTSGGGALIPGWKGAGARLTVFPVVPALLGVTATVYIKAGYDFDTVLGAVASAIGQYIQSLSLGSEAVFNELVTAALNVPGTGDILFTSPTFNVTPRPTERIITGIVSLTGAAFTG